jgi:hypothetical protein
MWRGLISAQRQAQNLISGSSPTAKTRLLSYNRTQSRFLTGLLKAKSHMPCHAHAPSKPFPCRSPAAFVRERDPVSNDQEAGWAPGPVWTGAENLASTGICFPDRQAHHPTYSANKVSGIFREFCFPLCVSPSLRLCEVSYAVFFFHGEDFLAFRPNPKPKEHPLSACSIYSRLLFISE